MAELRTYRHAQTGIVAEYAPELAVQFPDLIEVEPGTKPLVYELIPQPKTDEDPSATQGTDSTEEPQDV